MGGGNWPPPASRIPQVSRAGYPRSRHGKKDNTEGLPSEGEEQQSQRGGHPNNDGNRSPLLTVQRVGSGALVPCAANPTGMVVAMAMPSHGVVAHHADLILAQLQAQLQVAHRQLDIMLDDAPSQAERISARDHLDTLSRWVTLAMATRSGGDADAPLDLPESIAHAANALATTGGRPRHYWREGWLAGRHGGEGDERTSRYDLSPGEAAPGPLTSRERKVLEILADVPPGEGLVGTEILAELPRRREVGVSQGTLTTRIMPALRGQGWEIPNRGGSDTTCPVLTVTDSRCSVPPPPVSPRSGSCLRNLPNSPRPRAQPGQRRRQRRGRPGQPQGSLFGACHMPTQTPRASGQPPLWPRSTEPTRDG